MKRRLRPLGASRAWWTVPARRAHVLAQIREYNILAEHSFWGRTPMVIRKELVAEAWQGEPPAA